MNISEVNQWLALIVTVSELAATAIGYTWTVKNDIETIGSTNAMTFTFTYKII